MRRIIVASTVDEETRLFDTAEYRTQAVAPRVVGEPRPVAAGRNEDNGSREQGRIAGTAGPVSLHAYLVRQAAGERQPHQLVGIFCAPSIEDLAGIVDEWFFPESLEAACLPSGGLYWPHEPDFPIPNRLTPEAAEEHPSLPDRPALTSAWDAMFYGVQTIDRWVPIYVAKAGSEPDAQSEGLLCRSSKSMID